MSFLKFPCLLLLLLTYIPLLSQQVILSGSIKNELGLPLEGAHVLLFDKSKENAPSYGITNEEGNFSIPVNASTSYALSITYIGYEKLTKELVVKSEDIVQNLVLKKSVNKLEEVVLDYKPAIQVKKDTTIYVVDSFATGKERKIRQIMRRLPGVEVSRDGEILVNNRKITKLLVEGKEFFNGQPKMGVDNIPADVIEEIQIIDDYQEIPFLKGFKESEDLALNVVLKRDKKQFVFGDLEGSGGIENRYQLHPSVYRYAEKSLINIIGDLNNTPQRSFTLSDYFAASSSEVDPVEFSRILSSPLGRLLLNEDYFDNSHFFQA